MLKYVEVQVGFSEVPEEIALCINISNCPIHCNECHSPHLWEDIGEELNYESLHNLINKNSGISCICLMGGDSSPKEIESLFKYIKSKFDIKTCWYSGKPLNPTSQIFKYLDYIKVGPYDKSKGGLDNPKTNQRFYNVVPIFRNKKIVYSFIDLTFKFRK